jgi:2-succinyl-5-enolpyruvyl-6-hydroxy-3-cyclohexene-1-carboxylate synthase
LDKSALENTQHIYDLVSLCVDSGVQNVILCPGSRCAPLLLGFGHHPNINVVSVPDERSGGFIGLGIAQQTNTPVVLICTSGTAAQNFYPSVTEAFYQKNRLIILTADRPKEWIDQWDGQTIHQEKLYEPHVKKSLSYSNKNLAEIKNELEAFHIKPYGPIHINVPIEEPFYPRNPDEIKYNSFEMIFSHQSERKLNSTDKKQLINQLQSSEKIMILCGQNEYEPELIALLNNIRIPIAGDVISNSHFLENPINLLDSIFKTEDQSLRPDFLITIGQSVISKSIKIFFRNNKPTFHWHIGIGKIGDPFQSLTKSIQQSPLSFFKDWKSNVLKINNQEKYFNKLLNEQKKESKRIASILDVDKYNYFYATKLILNHLPKDSVLHLGNSMPVRIVNLLGLNNTNLTVWSNRGTSGIDGVLSTAIGHALSAQKKYHTLILGDISFFYDRNALWINHELPKNIRIIVLNDYGGGIFKMIPGPSNQKHFQTLFTTPHNRTAESTAKEFDLHYSKASSKVELETMLKEFKAGILEVFTKMNKNKEVFNLITKRG